MTVWLNIRVFHPDTRMSATSCVRVTRKGTAHYWDLRRALRGGRKIPLRFVDHGVRDVNEAPPAGFPAHALWDGEPPDLTPHIGADFRARFVGIKDKW